MRMFYIHRYLMFWTKGISACLHIFAHKENYQSGIVKFLSIFIFEHLYSTYNFFIYFIELATKQRTMLEKLGLDYRPFSSHTKKRRQMANVDFLLRCLFAWKKYVCTERSLLLILVGGLLAFSPPAFWELLQCLTLWSAVVEFCYYILG